MVQAPWSDIGKLQQEVSDLQGRLRGKVDAHEIRSLRSKVDSLERTTRELRAEIDGFRYGLQELEAARDEQP